MREFTGLTRPQASRQQRWQSFAWLCHLVADLHQPMHAGFADDLGGNRIEVIFEDEPMNLHHFWDTALINQQAGSWQYLVGQLGVFPPAPATRRVFIPTSARVRFEPTESS